MKHHFTLDYLKTVALTAGKAQLNISDKKGSYLVARIGSRKRSWYCVKKIRGRKGAAKSIYIGNIMLMGLEEARKISRRLAAICDEGKDPTLTASAQQGITVQEAWERFRKYRVDGLRKRTFQMLELYYRRYLSHLSDRALFSIDGRTLADVVNKNEAKYSAIRASRLFNRLWTMVAGELPKEDARLLPESPLEVMREKILGRAQFNKYLRHGETSIIRRKDLGLYMAYLEERIAEQAWPRFSTQCQIYLLCLHTGLRFTEAATLKWTSIDWEGLVLKIGRAQSKTMVEHIVHLSTYIREFLREIQLENELRKEPSIYVFPRPSDMDKPTALCTRSAKKVSEVLGYKFTSHANRKSFFCFAIKTCKVDFVSAQKMMNHKTKGRTVAEKHYAMLEEFDPDGLSKEFETVSRMLVKERESYLLETGTETSIR